MASRCRESPKEAGVTDTSTSGTPRSMDSAQTSCLRSAALLTPCLLSPFRPSTGSFLFVRHPRQTIPGKESEVGTYWDHSRRRVPPAGPSAVPGTLSTPAGFKHVSTTQIKAPALHNICFAILFHLVPCGLAKCRRSHLFTTVTR